MNQYREFYKALETVAERLGWHPVHSEWHMGGNLVAVGFYLGDGGHVLVTDYASSNDSDFQAGRYDREGEVPLEFVEGTADEVAAVVLRWTESH